jgi:hypothetical protein
MGRTVATYFRRSGDFECRSLLCKEKMIDRQYDVVAAMVMNDEQKAN